MGIRQDYVKVTEAADILGVAPNTVRKWGADGRIPEHRHPVNGYRLYRRSDLDRILADLERSVSEARVRS